MSRFFKTEAEEISTTEFSDRSSADITENGEDEDMLQDQMDKYTDVPYISGKADCSKLEFVTFVKIDYSLCLSLYTFSLTKR